MSTRKLLVLSGVFLALLAFVILFERHQPTSEEAAQAKKKLVSWKAEDVVALSVERPELPGVALQRDGTSRWTLEGKTPMPADSPTADALVSALSSLELMGETRTGVDPKEFGLDAPRATAVVTLKGGEKKTIRFGKDIPGSDATAAAEGSRFAAVKFAPIAQMLKPLDDFRSKSLVEVPTQEITRITIVKGAAKTVLVRGERADKTPGEWHIQTPVADLASQSFLDQLLSDLQSARVAEYVNLPATELARVGLAPPAVLVTLEKGAEVVSSVGFGAAKADAAGKVYARRGDLVMLVDDRVAEDLGKEFSAFRENRICPIDSWAVTRVSFEANSVRTGAEKVEGEWRSGGRSVPASSAEDLVDKVSRSEARRFVPKKDYAAAGIPVAKKGKTEPPLAVYEVTPEKATAATTVSFYPAAPVGAAPMLAVEVSGRSEAMLVDRIVLDDLKGLAARLRASGLGIPTPSPAPEAAAAHPTEVPTLSLAPAWTPKPAAKKP